MRRATSDVDGALSRNSKDSLNGSGIWRGSSQSTPRGTGANAEDAGGALGEIKHCLLEGNVFPVVTPRPAGVPTKLRWDPTFHGENIATGSISVLNHLNRRLSCKSHQVGLVDKVDGIEKDIGRRLWR
jgi:hypothetical protein